MPQPAPSCANRLLLFGVILLVLTVPALGQGPQVQTDVRHDVSQPLTELVKQAPASAAGVQAPEEQEEVHPIPLPPGLKSAQEPDLALQKANLAPATSLPPAVLKNFDGIGGGVFGFQVQGAPPDANG